MSEIETILLDMPSDSKETQGSAAKRLVQTEPRDVLELKATQSARNRELGLARS